MREAHAHYAAALPKFREQLAAGDRDQKVPPDLRTAPPKESLRIRFAALRLPAAPSTVSAWLYRLAIRNHSPKDNGGLGRVRADKRPARAVAEAVLSQLLIASEPLVVARPGHAVAAAGKGHVPTDLLGMADDGKASGRVPRDFSFRQLVSSLHFAGDLKCQRTPSVLESISRRPFVAYHPKLHKKIGGARAVCEFTT